MQQNLPTHRNLQNSTKSIHQQHKKKLSDQKLQPSSQLLRSPLSTSTFIKWFRTRYDNSNRKNNQYLYFPQQLMRENSIQQIFIQFDADGSGGLSRDQVFDMFNGFGISITMDNLNQLYDSVEVNLEELNSEKFKKCALGEKSNKVFREIVRGLEEENVYLPHNFTNMIIYLVYLSKRQQLKKEIIQEDNKIQEKVTNLDSLLKLKDLSMNNQRLIQYSDTLKKNLKGKFRDIWEKVNQKHSQKFPMTQRLEEEFWQWFKQIQNKKKENQMKKDGKSSKLVADVYVGKMFGKSIKGTIKNL